MTGKTAYENPTVAAVFAAALTATVHPVRIIDLDCYEANLTVELDDDEEELWFIRVRPGTRTHIRTTTGRHAGQHDGAEATDADHETLMSRLLAECQVNPELIQPAFTSRAARAAWRVANDLAGR